VSLRSIASLQRSYKYASARRFLARLAAETFLNSLCPEFLKSLFTSRLSCFLFSFMSHSTLNSTPQLLARDPTVLSIICW
jgi:hypothetical protein